MVIFLSLILLLLPTRFIFSESIRIGILSNGMEEEEYRIVRSILEGWLSKMGFTVLTRDELKLLLEEKKGVSYHLFEGDENLGKLGKLMGADLLLVLEQFTRFGYGEGVIVRVINVENGEILFVKRRMIRSSERDREIEEFSKELAEILMKLLVKNDGRVFSRSFILQRVSENSCGPVRYSVEIMKSGYFCVFVERNGYFERIYSKYVLPSKLDLILNMVDPRKKLVFTLTDGIPKRIVSVDDMESLFERGACVCDSPF